jgi:replicative DNA helicase
MEKTFKKDHRDGLPITRIPPHSEEAEKGIIGSVLLDNAGIYAPVVGKFGITADSFYIPAHRLIWETITDLTSVSSAVDLLTVTAKMKTHGNLDKIGGAIALNRIVDAVPTSTHFEHYCEIVRKNALLRNIIEACRGIEKDAYDCEDADNLAGEAPGRLASLGCVVIEHKSVEDVNKTIMERFRNAKKGGGSFIQWHLKGLCFHMAGAPKGKMTLVAARPGEGKSTFANGLAHFTAKAGGWVGVWSMEMTELEWRENMVGAMLGLEVKKFKEGRASEQEMDEFMQGLEASKELPICIDDRTYTIDQLVASIRRTINERKLDLVVIDYLGHIKPAARKGEKRNEEVSGWSNALTNLAKDYPDTAFVVLHQLNRGSVMDGNKRPELHHLRDSGALEQDAYAVLFIYQDPNVDGNQMDDAQTIIEIAKNRGGPKATATVYFQKSKQRFRTDI